MSIDKEYLDRYKKEFVTKVNIDSLNRNVSLYPNSNSFLLPFSRVFNNVKKVVINDIIFPNVNQSVSNVNNNLSWQYGSSEYLISNSRLFALHSFNIYKLLLISNVIKHYKGKNRENG